MPVSWEFYDPPENSAPVEFCTGTSLHGLQYVGQPKRHMVERIFWLVTFTAAVITAGVLIYNLWSKYLDSPIMTVFDAQEAQLNEVPFPGVTICNINKVKMSKWNESINRIKLVENLPPDHPDFLKPLAALADLLRICQTNTFSKRLVRERDGDGVKSEREIREVIKSKREQLLKYRNYTGMLRESAHQCEEMILFCSWGDEIQADCTKLFQEVETDYGHCCSFNAIPASLLLKNINDSRDSPRRMEYWRAANLSVDNLLFTEEIRGPRRQKYPGVSGGLTLLLDPALKEYSCPNTDSQGFAIGINGALDFPRMKDNGMLVGTGSEVFINVHPEITKSEPEVRQHNLDKRNCLFSDEKELTHYSIYTTPNCLNECIARKTMQMCGCVRDFMPRSLNDTVCVMEKIKCSADVEKNITTSGLSKECNECLPTCNDIEYISETTWLTVRANFMDALFEAYPNHANVDPGNITIVHVYIGVESIYPRLRKEVYSWVDLISNTGGLLGLCMGFSMLSLLEVLYYWSIRLCCKYRRRKLERRGQTQRQFHLPGPNQNQKIFEFRQLAYNNQRWLSNAFSRSSGNITNVGKNDIFFTPTHNQRRRSSTTSSSSGSVTPYLKPPSFQTQFSRGYDDEMMMRRGFMYY